MRRGLLLAPLVLVGCVDAQVTAPSPVVLRERPAVVSTVRVSVVDVAPSALVAAETAPGVGAVAPGFEPPQPTLPVSSPVPSASPAVCGRAMPATSRGQEHACR